VHVQAAVEHADVDPAVARRDRRPRLLARSPDLVRRDPRVDEVGAQLRQFAQLLDEVLELVERRPAGRGEVMEGAAVGPGPRPPGSMPFRRVFSGVAQGPHQSTPNSSNSFSVVAPLMNAHSSPMGLRQNDLMLRSVMAGNPWSSGNAMVCCMTVSALTPLAGLGLDPRAEDALKDAPVLRGSGPLTVRQVLHDLDSLAVLPRSAPVPGQEPP
jgi:hypothetical protein